MGISADLIELGEFGEFNDGAIDDLNSVITLYEFLPEHLHTFIKQISVEIIDDEYYRTQFNDPSLTLTIWDSESGITYTSEETGNKIKIPHSSIVSTNVIVNSIGTKNLGYIGGKEMFKSDIYSIYDSREHFPYLWNWSERDIIMNTVPDWLLEKCLYTDTTNVYIDLGY